MDLDLTNASWRKSSHSSANCGACIEVAEGFVGVMPVRDSKDPSGPALLFPTAAWQAFVTAIRTGELDTH